MRQILDPRYGLIFVPDRIDTEDCIISATNNLILVDRELIATYKFYQENLTLKHTAATAAVGDLVFDLWSGPVLIDRLNGIMRRMYLDDETIKWEETTSPRGRDIVFASTVGFVLTDTVTGVKTRRYFYNNELKRETV
jgi:hypothetical protein